MHILPVLAVTAGLLVEANSEAFFVANLLGGNNVRSSRPGFVRAPALAPGRVHHPAPRPSREVGGQAHYPGKQNFQKPQRHQKPQFSKKPVFHHRPGYPKAKPLHHVNQQPGGRLTHHANKPRLPTYPKTKADPGANQKLDYGGWKPIDFDDSLPSERKPVASKPSAVKVDVEVPDPQIVTLDAAIAAAPPAQTDDIQHPILTVYEPLVKTVSASYTAPQAVVTKAGQPSSNSLSTIYSDTKPYQPKSSYGSPVPAVPYIPSTAEHSPTYVTSNNAPQPSYQVLHANNPAVAPKYEAPKPKFQTPQYLPRPAVPKPLYKSTPSPALPPKYEPEPAVAPKYEQPAAAPRYQLAPAPAPAYEAAPVVAQEAAPAPAYEAPEYQTVVTAKPDVVILPAYTPAPPAFSPDPSYSEPQELYENTQFGGEEFPIVALITAESDVPEHEKFVSFSIGGSDNAGSPDTVAPPGEYQATQDNTRLAKDVSSGSVYVQQGDKEAGKTDELYYIYYQDPELDPSYGVKIQSEREAKFIEAPVSTLDAPSLGQAPGLDIPLYDYDEAASAETFRSERDQPSYAESYTNQRSARQPTGYEFDPEPSNPFYKTSSKSSSSVSFNLNVGGKTSGFSYSL